MSDTDAPPNIKEEITRLRSLLSNQLTEAQKRPAPAEAGWKAADNELKEATAVAVAAETQSNAYANLFPTPTAPAKGNAKPGPAAKPGPVAKSVSNGTP